MTKNENQPEVADIFRMYGEDYRLKKQFILWAVQGNAPYRNVPYR